MLLQWKKIIIFTLCFALCSTFCGCKKEKVYDTSPEYNAETDYNTYYDNYGMGSQFVETEDGYYYTSGLFLHFIDKKLMKEIPLCSKIECSHTVEDAEICMAFRGGIYAKEEVFIYQGKLYGFIENYVEGAFGQAGVFLCELSKDGTAQKKIWELDWKGGSSGYFLSSALHRGVLYFYVKGEHSISVYGYDLEKDKCTLLYDNPDQTGSYLIPIGDFIYWREMDVIDAWNETYTYIRYQISTGDVTKIDGVTHCFATKDKVFFERFDPEVGKRRIYSTNRDGTDFQEIDALIDGVGHADERYLYGHPYGGGDFTTVNVYDIDTFELVAQLEIPEEVSDGGPAEYLIPGNGNVMFLYDYFRKTVYYGYKSEITTGNFQWHQVEKVN